MKYIVNKIKNCYNPNTKGVFMDNSFVAIRNVFSKAAIAISGGGYSVVYASTPDYLIQEIAGVELRLLRLMVHECSSIRMRTSEKETFSIRFSTSNPTGIVEYFPPIDTDARIDYDAIASEMAIPSPEFIEFYFKSKGKFIEGAEEFIESVMERSGSKRTDAQQVSDYNKWAPLEKAITELDGLVGLEELDVSIPDKYSEGFIEFIVSKGLSLNGNALEAFSRALDLSSEISFEICVDPGKTAITLFP